MLKKWLTNYLPENRQYYINITGDIEVLRTLLKRYSGVAKNAFIFKPTKRLFSHFEYALLFLELPAEKVQEIETYLDANYRSTRALQDVSVLFVDIRNSAAIVDNRGINEYQSLITKFYNIGDAILKDKHRSSLVKHLGDGIMAVFGAPYPDIYHAANAVSSAIEISDKLKETGLKVGLGISTGSALIKIFSESAELRNDILGQPPNIAARFQTLTKNTDAKIIIGVSTYRCLSIAAKQQFILLSGSYPVRGFGKLDIYGWPKTSGALSSSEYDVLFQEDLKLLNLIEENFVHIIKDVLIEKYGEDNWWKKGIPVDVRKALSLRLEEDKDTSKLEKIQYADFTDCLKIVLAADNKGTFEYIFGKNSALKNWKFIEKCVIFRAEILDRCEELGQNDKNFLREIYDALYGIYEDLHKKQKSALEQAYPNFKGLFFILAVILLLGIVAFIFFRFLR